MTRDDCLKILENIDLIRHFANGGEVQHCLHTYKGEFVRWQPSRKTILISCLGSYRIVKPHVVLTPDGPKAATYKHPCNGAHLQ